MQNVPGMKHGGEITVRLEWVVHLKAQDVIMANAFHYVYILPLDRAKKIPWYRPQQKIYAFTCVGFAALYFEMSFIAKF